MTQKLPVSMAPKDFEERVEKFLRGEIDDQRMDFGVAVKELAQLLYEAFEQGRARGRYEKE